MTDSFVKHILKEQELVEQQNLENAKKENKIYATKEHSTMSSLLRRLLSLSLPLYLIPSLQMTE